MDYKTLRQAARESLDKAAYPPKRLALIYTGVTLLLSLLMTAVSFLLSRSYQGAVGIQNLDRRAILETVQVGLSFANLIFTPLWSMGFMAVALRTARWSNAEPRDLLDGFRHWGTVLRLYILQIGLALLVVFATSWISTIIFSITPFSRGLTSAVQQAMEAGQDQVMLDMNALLPQILPLYGIMLVVAAVIGIPLFYRFRMAQFAVAAGETGARRAMSHSTRIMQNNRMSLFRLDLHFWWYYGALLLITALGYADKLLPLLNISLPVSETVLTYGSYGLYLVAHLLFCWQFSMEVRTTYAHAYEQLNTQLPPEPEVRSDPTQNPWAHRDQEAQE